MEYVLQTDNLTVKYGKFKALDGMTINVPKDSIYGLIGRNGSGKTTLFRTVCGMLLPKEGSYSIYGTDNSDKKIGKVRRRMAAIVESPAIYQDMTAYENLKYQFDLLGCPSYDRINELLELVGIPDTGKKKAKQFSLGMRQRLGIAIALCGNPDFIMLDEPVNGLDPQGIIELRELIIKLNKEQHITFVISSHILDELSRMATHYGIVDKGRIVEEISAADLISRCRKCIRVDVNDISALARVLDGMKIEYSIDSESGAEVFGDVNINKLVTALDKEGCQVLSINCSNEDLESYFIRLVGGANND